MDSNLAVASFARKELIEHLVDLIKALIRDETQDKIDHLAVRMYELENDGLRTTVGILQDRIDGADGKIRGLELKASQTVSVKIDGDIGERLDALEARIDDCMTESDVEERIDTAISDKVSDLDLDDKIGEYINSLTFTVTVD